MPERPRRNLWSFLAAIAGAVVLTPWLGVFIARNAWVALVTSIANDYDRSAIHTAAAHGGLAALAAIWGGLIVWGWKRLRRPR
jgi:hypothetical protein